MSRARLNAARGFDTDNRSSIPQINNRTPLSFDEFQTIRRRAEQDLQTARNLLTQRQNELANWNEQAQSNFQSAFGTTDPAARDQVRNTIDNALARNITADNLQITPNAHDGVYAWVDPSDPSTVYLDQAYPGAATTGQDSGPGVLAHELSHFNTDTGDGTRDYAYGLGGATSLVQNYQNWGWLPSWVPFSPVQPWTNADNMEYYVEGAFSQGASADTDSGN